MGDSNPNGTTALKRDGFELEDTFTVSAHERGLMDKLFSRRDGAAKRRRQGMTGGWYVDRLRAHELVRMTV